MSFPTPPSVDLPRWAYSGGVYQEPSLTQRETGWQAVPGQNYAEPPPYQWVNWLGYSTGEWINYVAAYAIPYLAQGQFDNGIKIYNNQQATFYNAANDKFTAIRSAPTQSAASVELTLPPALPTTPMPMVSDTAGNLSFSTISSSAVAGITNGSAPISGQVGQYFFYHGNVTIPDGTLTILSSSTYGSGIWKFSATVELTQGIASSFSTKNIANIFFNKTPTVPLDQYVGSNFIGVSSYDQTIVLNLLSFYVNSSSTFTVYLGTNTVSIGNVDPNVNYSFFAQRIA